MMTVTRRWFIRCSNILCPRDIFNEKKKVIAIIIIVMINCELHLLFNYHRKFFRDIISVIGEE